MRRLLPGRCGSPPRSRTAAAWSRGRNRTRSRTAAWRPPGNRHPGIRHQRRRPHPEASIFSTISTTSAIASVAPTYPRRQYPQRGHVLAEQLDLACGKVAPVDAVAGRALEQRIVHVGDVLAHSARVTAIQPQSMYQVKRQVGGGVTQMGGVVRRDAADVHGRGGSGRHRADLPIRGVVEPELRSAARQHRNLSGRPRLHPSTLNARTQRHSWRMAASRISARSARHITKSGRYGSSWL